jgi:hypothetical protein
VLPSDEANPRPQKSAVGLEEIASMRSQNATASKRNIRYQPLAFTEHGVVMLSSVLNSPRAVQVSILVVESFIRLRELTAENKYILIGVEKLERGHDRTVSVIEILVDDIDHLADDLKQMKTLPTSPKRKIGFDL